ncbi:MAG: endonuclease/exonuclease/phosphatase family protein [Deltaproteobacteria bacterium]|nr:endonuclease/exonuclease/phosphatase family protein [Deltaproteobacteria bacterium]
MGFSLATFNVRDLFDDVRPHVIGQLDRDGFNIWAQRRARTLYGRKLEAVAAMVARADADVVALQEVEGQVVLEALRGVVAPYGYTAAVVGAQDERGISCGVLSRLPVQSSEVHGVGELAFPVFAEGDQRPFSGRLRSRRGVLEVNVTLPDGGALCLLVVHLKSARALPRLDAAGNPLEAEGHYGAAEGAARAVVVRLAEALQVRSLVEARLMRDSRAQLAVLGDFNDTPGSVVLRSIAGELAEPPRGRGSDLEAATVLEAGVLFHCARSVPAEARYTIVYRGVGQQVDHVLVSRALWRRFRGARILNEYLKDGQAEGREDVESDHAPLVATFA